MAAYPQDSGFSAIFVPLPEALGGSETAARAAKKTCQLLRGPGGPDARMTHHLYDHRSWSHIFILLICILYSTVKSFDEGQHVAMRILTIMLFPELDTFNFMIADFDQLQEAAVWIQQETLKSGENIQSGEQCWDWGFGKLPPSSQHTRGAAMRGCVDFLCIYLVVLNMYCPKTKLQAKARADAAQSFAAGKKALEEDMLSWAFLLSNCFVQSACPPVDRWWFLYPALTSMPCPEPILIWIRRSTISTNCKTNFALSWNLAGNGSTWRNYLTW